MRAVVFDRPGDESVLRVGEVPAPAPGPRQLLVRVAATAVNRADLLQRRGSYPPPPGASPYLGLEASGEVVALGQAVSRWKLGDRVCALTNGGAYAEYVAAPEGQTLPAPAGLSLVQAAALPETYFTVFTNVIERGRLKSGETILIHGGSSGIGITAIQMAKAWGATVYTTVGNAEKAKACLALGADVAIDYRKQDFVDEVTKLTDKRGVDVILDMVGGDYIARNLRCLALEGRLVQIAFLQSPKVEIDWTPLMVKRLTYTGSTLRPRPPAEKARLADELRTKIWPQLEQGRMLPVIHKVFPLAEAGAAHALMESSTHIGKIMLEVGGG